MSVVQDTFNQYRDNAYEGQVSTIQEADIVSRSVESAAVPFGRAVVNGAGERSCANVSGGTVAANVKGFSVRTMAVENNASDLPEYAVGEVASILRKGKMYALCPDGAAKDATVKVVINVAGGDELGQLRGTADAGNTIELNQVKWVEAVAAGDIGEIAVDGILAS